MADEKKSGSFTPEAIPKSIPEPSDLDGMNLTDDPSENEDGEDGEDSEL